MRCVYLHEGILSDYDRTCMLDDSVIFPQDYEKYCKHRFNDCAEIWKKGLAKKYK